VTPVDKNKNSYLRQITVLRNVMEKNLCVNIGMNQGEYLFGERHRNGSQEFIAMYFVK
jgi:hypothetical protein